MSNDPKHPAVGDLVIDASRLTTTVVDMTPDQLIGLRTSQPGCEDAVVEVRSNQPVLGVLAGVRDEDVADIDNTVAQMSDIQSLLPPSRKLVVLLEETYADLDYRLQRHLFTIASSVERRAKMLRNSELRARYGKTRAYRSATGLKAARTRQRNLLDNQQPAVDNQPPVVDNQPSPVDNQPSPVVEVPDETPVS